MITLAQRASAISAKQERVSCSDSFPTHMHVKTWDENIFLPLLLVPDLWPINLTFNTLMTPILERNESDTMSFGNTYLLKLDKRVY